jgi:tetratricopeptide (TPR) repeat protein
MQDFVVTDSRNLKTRVALVAAVVFALALGWLGVRWQLGIMLADLTRTTDSNASQIADMAVTWAPSDPYANSLKASTGESIQAYEQTVRLSPNDYRWRIELGRFLEQDGQTERAEIEFKKAIELAPSYAYPRWHLGNFYLRQDRNDDAIAELKRAAENNQTYRDQVFSLAWDYFNKDAAQLENLAGTSPESRSQLAYFFAAEKLEFVK